MLIPIGFLVLAQYPFFNWDRALRPRIVTCSHFFLTFAA